MRGLLSDDTSVRELGTSFERLTAMRYFFRSVIIATMLTLLLFEATAASATTASHFPRRRTLTTHLSVPVRSVTAGSSIAGTVVVNNKTGHPLTFVGCGGVFEAALTTTGRAEDASVPRFLCAVTYTIPTGVSRYQVKVTARYPSCSSTSPPDGLACLAGGEPPPLPPGRYYFTAVPTGGDVAPPRAVAVHVHRERS